MASALLINDGALTQTHAGIQRLINLNYVKKGILTKDDSKLINKLFSMRQQGDYGDIFAYEKDEIYETLALTNDLLNKLRSLIKV